MNRRTLTLKFSALLVGATASILLASTASAGDKIPVGVMECV
jgi:hypothetical protein